MDARRAPQGRVGTLAQVTSLPRTETFWWTLPAAATLGVLALITVGLQPQVLPALYLATVTPTLCGTDVVERRLPNAAVLPGYLAAAAGMLGSWATTGSPPVLAAATGAMYFVVLYVLAIAGGMGMGDVKLAGVLGLAAGLLGPTAALVAPAAAFLLGGVAAVVGVRRGAATSIPFGPYLLAGFWIAVMTASGLSPGESST